MNLASALADPIVSDEAKIPWLEGTDVGDGHWIGYGFHGTTMSYELGQLWHVLNVLGKGVFFDMGCGGGLPMLVAWAQGWDSYGCDLDADAVRLAQARFNALSINGYTNALRAVHASFFPKGFDLDRPMDKTDEFGEDILEHTNGQPDAYSLLGIAPGDVDLWYHYQVEKESNLLRFFAQYGKPGSMLMLARTMVPGELRMPAEVCFEEYPGLSHFVFYTKQYIYKQPRCSHS